MDKYDIELLKKGMEEIGVCISEQQVNEFLRYYEILAEWNKIMNLTAIIDFNDVVRKHFLDSVSIVKAYSFNLEKEINVIDIGTGAGFPGIPIKIVFPYIKITLLDSLKKRVQFLEHVIEELNLKDIETIHGRSEDYAKMEKYREKYDLCVSRAVANLSTLTEYCLCYVKHGGVFVSYKSEKGEEEIEKARKAIVLLGGEIIGSTTFKLPSSDITRILISIRKVKKTPEEYPRRAGIPQKKPLSVK